MKDIVLNYKFDFTRFNEHLLGACLQFRANQNNPVLWLPSWIAGSYLIREFAKNITAVFFSVSEVDGQVKRAKKLSKNEWYLQGVKSGDMVVVHYEVYCYDLSVRTAYLDQFRLYGNFTSMALAVAGQEHEKVRVVLSVPEAFFEGKQKDKVQFACGLQVQCQDNNGQTLGGEYVLTVDSYDILVDYPFEIAEQDSFEFVVKDKAGQSLSHRFFVSGRHQACLERLKRDLKKICQCYVGWLEDTPFTDYTFLTFASGNDYGGLEHINSTSLVTPRDDLPRFNEQVEPSESYQRFLGLCSHEYFHAWWVKTVRPDVMMQADFRQEVYTPLLWVFEGFTSYIDDFMLQSSGVISKDSYLKLLMAQINRYQQTHGRAFQSVAESSFDAWIKLYRADENTANAGVSYYNKGALVALCLDLTLCDYGARLFDVVKVFYQKAKAEENRRIGMSEQSLDDVLTQFLPVEVWQAFKAHYIDGVAELPLAEMLNKAGLQIHYKDTPIIWGLKTVADPMGLKVQRVLRESQASQAGMSAYDMIVAIDGIKASEKQLQVTAYQQKFTGQAVVCHVFRRDELITVKVPVFVDNQSYITDQFTETWKLNLYTEDKTWLDMDYHSLTEK